MQAAKESEQKPAKPPASSQKQGLPGLRKTARFEEEAASPLSSQSMEEQSSCTPHLQDWSNCSLRKAESHSSKSPGGVKPEESIYMFRPLADVTLML